MGKLAGHAFCSPFDSDSVFPATGLAVSSTDPSFNFEEVEMNGNVAGPGNGGGAFVGKSDARARVCVCVCVCVSVRR